MTTCRRVFLDKLLNENISLIRGSVLDIGGKKVGPRGSFVPPFKNVSCWKYVNSDPATEPDFCCDAANIPADGCFETIIMTELLEYIQEPQAVLNEAFRLLCVGGTCLVSVPFMIPVHGDREFDRCRYTEIAIAEYARTAGFKHISIRPMGSVFCVVYDIFRAAFSYASKKPQSLILKICRQILKIFQPLCLWADERLLKNLSGYITTGYFVILKKSN